MKERHNQRPAAEALTALSGALQKLPAARQVPKVFDFSDLDPDLRQAAGELAAELGAAEGPGPAVTAFRAPALSVRREGAEIRIGYAEKYEFFRGLAMAFAGEEGEQTSRFSHLTFMADCSRNAVLALPAAKRLIRLLAACGYDRLQLYTEDTYRVAGRPAFGLFRGAYTEEELRELDGYASRFGITLMPCIQTLAHLNAIFRWPEFAPLRDCDDILLCGAEETYALLEDLFAQLARSFTCREVHIGMDEAHRVGLGQYLDRFGPKDRFAILAEHLSRVTAIAKKHGFTCRMWGDMFFRLAFGGEYYRFDRELPAEAQKAVPEGVRLIYWDYYQTDRTVYDGMLDCYKKLGAPLAFAGGAWKWSGFLPQNGFSLLTSRQALDSCESRGVDDITVTAWGDNGGEASVFSVLPVMVYYAERRYGGDLEAAFPRIAGCALADFLTLDLPDVILRDPPEGYLANYSKIFLYNDPMLGIFDGLVRPETASVLDEAASKLRRAAARCARFSPLFRTALALLAAVREKLDFGRQLREAYAARDREAMAGLCKKLDRIERKVRAFHAAFSEQWAAENKAPGKEVQDIRLGGLCARVRACRQRLSAYLAGEIGELEELSDRREWPECPKGFVFNNWAELASACPF